MPGARPGRTYLFAFGLILLAAVAVGQTTYDIWAQDGPYTRKTDLKATAPGATTPTLTLGGVRVPTVSGFKAGTGVSVSTSGGDVTYSSTASTGDYLTSASVTATSPITATPGAGTVAVGFDTTWPPVQGYITTGTLTGGWPVSVAVGGNNEALIGLDPAFSTIISDTLTPSGLHSEAPIEIATSTAEATFTLSDAANTSIGLAHAQNTDTGSSAATFTVNDLAADNATVTGQVNAAYLGSSGDVALSGTLYIGSASANTSLSLVADLVTSVALSVNDVVGSGAVVASRVGQAVTVETTGGEWYHADPLHVIGNGEPSIDLGEWPLGEELEAMYNDFTLNPIYTPRVPVRITLPNNQRTLVENDAGTTTAVAWNRYPDYALLIDKSDGTTVAAVQLTAANTTRLLLGANAGADFFGTGFRTVGQGECNDLICYDVFTSGVYSGGYDWPNPQLYGVHGAAALMQNDLHACDGVYAGDPAGNIGGMANPSRTNGHLRTYGNLEINQNTDARSSLSGFMCTSTSSTADAMFRQYTGTDGAHFAMLNTDGVISKYGKPQLNLDCATYVTAGQFGTVGDIVTSAGVTAAGTVTAGTLSAPTISGTNASVANLTATEQVKAMYLGSSGEIQSSGSLTVLGAANGHGAANTGSYAHEFTGAIGLMDASASVTNPSGSIVVDAFSNLNLVTQDGPLNLLPYNGLGYGAESTQAYPHEFTGAIGLMDAAAIIANPSGSLSIESFTNINLVTQDGPLNLLPYNGLGYGAASTQTYAHEFTGSIGLMDASAYFYGTGSINMAPASPASFTVGDGGTTDYTAINATGHQTMAGAATVWDDVTIPGFDVRLAGVSDPAWAKFKDNGAGSTGVFLWWFDPGTIQQVYFTIQLPHKWKEGSAIKPHVHWTPEVTADGAPANQTVEWGLEYTKASPGGDYGNTAIVYAKTHSPADANVVAGRHYRTNFADITMSGNTISTILVCRLFRNATDATDDTYEHDAGFLAFDIHVECDSIGSDTDTAK